MGFDENDRFAPKSRVVGAFRSLSQAQSAAESALDEEVSAWARLFEHNGTSALADGRDRPPPSAVQRHEPKWHGTPEATDYSAAAQLADGVELFACRVEVRRRQLAELKAEAERSAIEAQRAVESLLALEAAPARTCDGAERRARRK